MIFPFHDPMTVGQLRELIKDEAADTVVTLSVEGTWYTVHLVGIGVRDYSNGPDGPVLARRREVVLS